MREQTAQIELKKGINPLTRPSRNGAFLSECKNLYVEENKLIPVEDINYEVGIPSGYPFPQFYVAQRYMFLLEKSAIHLILDDWSVNTIFEGISEYDTWHVADFEDFVVFSNGSVVLCWPQREWRCFDYDRNVPDITCYQYW